MLHVVRWRRDELPALDRRDQRDRATALTHGIHTRIDETVAAILARVRAGNVYVNRNIDRRGRRRAAVRRPRAVRHGPEGRRAALRLRRLVRGGGAARAAGDAPIALPGPTGESNTLEFHPRGVVACIAADERGAGRAGAGGARARATRCCCCVIAPVAARRAMRSMRRARRPRRRARSGGGRRGAARRGRRARAARAPASSPRRRAGSCPSSRPTRRGATTGRGSSSSAR